MTRLMCEQHKCQKHFQYRISKYFAQTIIGAVKTLTGRLICGTVKLTPYLTYVKLTTDLKQGEERQWRSLSIRRQEFK